MDPTVTKGAGLPPADPQEQAPQPEQPETGEATGGGPEELDEHGKPKWGGSRGKKPGKPGVKPSWGGTR